MMILLKTDNEHEDDLDLIVTLHAYAFGSSFIPALLSLPFFSLSNSSACTMRAIFVPIFLLLGLCGSAIGFSVSPQTSLARPESATLLRAADNEDQGEKLAKLGYSTDEIRRGQSEGDKEEIKVRVDLIDDVDPITLTALGFGLIFLNFFVFSNLGDGGISGVVATIINTLDQ